MLKHWYDRHELVRSDVEQVICSVCDSRLGVPARTVGSIWGNTIVKSANSTTMISARACSIVTIVVSAELAALRTSSTAKNAYLFDSMKDTVVMKCGHTMHRECYNEMLKRDKFSCSICTKSVMDMSAAWKLIDEEIEATMMPYDYRHKKAQEGIIQ